MSELLFAILLLVGAPVAGFVLGAIDGAAPEDKTAMLED